MTGGRAVAPMVTTHDSVMRSTVPFWLRPDFVIAVAVTLSVVPIWLYSDASLRSDFGVAKHFGLGTGAAITAMGAACFIGAAVMLRATPVRTSAGRPRLVASGLDRAGVLWTQVVVAAFIAWIVVGIARGISPGTLMLSILRGEPGASSRARRALDPIPLLSVFLHQAPIAASLSSIQLGLGTSSAPRVIRRLIAILCIGLAWAYLHSERLALVSIVISASLSYLLARMSSNSSRPMGIRARRRLTTLFLLSPIAAIGMFTLFERSRSWTAVDTEQSLVDYGTERFFGYYAVATNSSSYLLRSHSPLLALPTRGTPGIGVLEGLRPVLPPAPSDVASFAETLKQSLNPEFNNPGGWGVPVLAFGLVGAAAVWLAVGGLAGRLFVRASSGSLYAVLVYPIVVTSILEAPRILMIASLRAIAPILGASLVCRMVRGRHVMRQDD